MTYKAVFQNLLKSYLFFGGSLESFNAEKWGGNRNKRFCGDILENTVFVSENSVGHIKAEGNIACG